MKAVILAYHRVTSLSTDPQLLAVSPRRFDEQLAALRAAFDPIPLTSLVASVKRGEKPAGVALTFDDGYSDNLHGALPLLERYEFPATVFVTSGYVGGTREFWWDELERILLVPASLPETLRLRIAGRSLAWDLGHLDRRPPVAVRAWSVVDRRDPTARHTAYRSLCSNLRRLAAQDRESLLEDLRRWAGVECGIRPSHRPMTEEELLELAKDGLVEIGAHTAEHPALAALPLSAQREEIEVSKRYLENVLGKDVAHFSYPFGRGRWPRQTYNGETVKLVEEAGYSAACALKPPIRRRPSPYELPRLIVQDWDGDELLRRIRLHLRPRRQSMPSFATSSTRDEIRADPDVAGWRNSIPTRS